MAAERLFFSDRFTISAILSSSSDSPRLLVKLRNFTNRRIPWVTSLPRRAGARPGTGRFGAAAAILVLDEPFCRDASRQIRLADRGDADRLAVLAGARLEPLAVGPLRPAPLHQDLQTVLRCHIAAFAALGGVPEEILYDRIKTAVIGEATEGRIVYHRTLLDFAGHYRFHPKACRPYRAKTKGKVEQPFRYVRQDFFLGRTGGRGAHARRRGWPQRLLLHTWRHYRFARQSQGQGCLRERSRWLARSALLIVDEIGYLPVTPGGGNLVFQLVNARYEKGAMILTSNRGFAE